MEILHLREKGFCCQSFTKRRSLFPLTLALGVLSFLIATQLQQRWSYRGEDHIDPAEAQRLQEVAHVSSILKAKGIDLNDGSIRDVAATILEESERYSLDPALVLGIIQVESRFRHRAVSTSGARGLMQIRPFIAAALAEEAGLVEWGGPKTLDDPIVNVKLGVFYLGYLKQEFKDLRLALSAYLLGPTGVQNRLDDKKTVPLDYAKKVLSISHTYREHIQQVVTSHGTKQVDLLSDRLEGVSEII